MAAHFQSDKNLPQLFFDKINIAPAPPTAFSTPAALESHLDANLPLPSTLTISIGTCTKETLSRIFGNDGDCHCDTRSSTLQAWANLLVRMTKAPSFDVRRLTLDMCPRNDCVPARHYFKLLTRVTAAIWQAGKRVGQVEKCVLVVKGWNEQLGGEEEDLKRCCVGVEVETVNTVKMGKMADGTRIWW